jgi:acylaminoacyl-peptidase
VYDDSVLFYKSSLNKPGQLITVKLHSLKGDYDFNNISIYEISPSRSLPNSEKFIVEHGCTLYGKI